LSIFASDVASTEGSWLATAARRHEVRRRIQRVPLADEVRDLIARDYLWSEIVTAGELLPSEGELSEHYDVSRVTVRAALRSLQEASLIRGRHGVGWVVLARPAVLTEGLDRLCSIETFGKEVGRSVGSADLRIDEIKADSAVAERLGIEPGHRVLAVCRVKTYGGSRVAWIEDYVPAGAIAFDVLRSEFRGSVLDVLLAHSELAVDYADCEIRPVNLDEEIAARLEIPTGTAALFMDEVTRSADCDAIEWSKAWLLPEHLHFSVRRRRQIGART